MGRKRLGEGTRSWHSGRKAASSCVQESAEFLPLDIGAQDQGAGLARDGPSLFGRSLFCMSQRLLRDHSLFSVPLLD